MTDPTIRPLSRDLVRRLGEPSWDRPVVLSLYLSLDPAEFGTPDARESQLNSLLTHADVEAGRHDLDHEETTAMISDIEAVRDLLTGEDVAAYRGADGLAVFVSTPLDLFEVVQLPFAPDSAAFVESSPMIGPLVESINAETWAVLLVNRRDAKLFRGTPHRLREIAEIVSDTHRQHSAGGWAQARYERSVERDVDIHLTETAERLFSEFEHARFDHLAVGCTEEMYPRIEAVLHDYVQRCLRGRVEVDVEHSSIEQIQDALRPLSDEMEVARERDVLDRLQQELGRGGRAVATRNDVWRALEERRVETLVLREPAGAEDLVEKALQQSADVLVVRHLDLPEKDAPAALLRF